jgi:hypothetical protein
MKDLFGHDVGADSLPPKIKKGNPMLRVYGIGPNGRVCGHCKFLWRKKLSKIYLKCELRGDTSGPGTDHRSKWAACGKFEETDQ